MQITYRLSYIVSACAFCIGAILAPLSVRAHEVYVLTTEEVEAALAQAPVSFWEVIRTHPGEFAFWAVLICTIVSTVFFVSISRRAERVFDPYLLRLKHYAPFAVRVTAGLAFLASAHYGALFGPELPLETLFGAYAGLAQLALAAVGVLFLIGFGVRIAALIALAIFGFATYQLGWYMLTYASYAGEILLFLTIGAHRVSLERARASTHGLARQWARASRYLGAHSFAIMRMAFGVGLVYASIHSKFLYNHLALTVVEKYHLTTVFPFDPAFLVFGAALIELMLGIFFIIGFEIRFSAIVLEIFLILSLLYFKELVWPHIVLLGLPIAFFMYGYDRHSLEGYFFKKGNVEPVF